MSQTSSGVSVLRICLAYYNTHKTYPSNSYLSFKTLNIQCQQYQDSNFTPRAISQFWVGLCSTLQTTLRITCRVLLIIVPAQSILIQSGQTTGCEVPLLQSVTAGPTECYRTVLWRAYRKVTLLVMQGLEDSDTSWGNRAKLTKYGLFSK